MQLYFRAQKLQRRRVLAFLLSLVFLCPCVLAACSETSTPPVSQQSGDNAPFSSADGKIAGISYTLEDIDESGLCYTLQNQSDIDYLFGEDYGLFIQKNGEWEAVPTLSGKRPVFFTFAYPLNAHSTAERHDINWSYDYGELSPGNYRGVKGISKSDDAEKNFEIWMDFTI